MKKKNNLLFSLITLSVAAISLGITIAAPIVSDYFAPSLDNYLGRGKIIYDGDATGGDTIDSDYYDQTYEYSQDGKYEASVNGYKVTEEIADEGIVLLKNNNSTLPLAQNSKVTPMGYRYTDPIMTGKGSGAATLLQSFVINAKQGLHNYFDVNAAFEATMDAASVSYATEEGYKGKADESGTFSGATTSVAEFPSSIYKTSEIGEYKTGIVFIGRQGGEGDDLQMTPYYSDPYQLNKIADHQLQLMPYEKEMVEFAKANFEKTIVIINSPNPMELMDLKDDDGIDAMLWVGTTGSRGFESLAKILCGKVNPSGRMVDTYYADFVNDPTYQNFGSYFYSNSSTDQFTEYEEGIYVGYKYYETRYGQNETEYAKQVVYPLGYGLHYDGDNVTQTLNDVTLTDGTVTVTGTIYNNSSYDVKESVQIYYGSPYNSASGIEKSDKNLIDFDKVSVGKGKSAQFTISFFVEDMASYDYKGYYTSGKGSYVLEKGDYPIYLGKNAHDSFGYKNISIEKTQVYYDSGSLSNVDYVGKRASDEVVATNQYEELNDYMDGEGEIGQGGATTQLSRSDDFESFPSSPAGKSAPQAVLDKLRDSDQGTDYSKEILAKYGNELPTSGAEQKLTLSELRGLDYDDPKWDELLDQLVYEGDDLTELSKLLGQGSFNTGKITAIGKPTTSEADGPQAIGKTGVSNGTGAANAYTGEVLTAATWNKNCALNMGTAIGEEALAQKSNGWYAPACNIHRSPFQGRVYEYYSEDPVLSGYMASYTVQGASQKGYTPYLKHFAVNEQENGRSYLSTWVNEQALRETYLKPFEMAVKYPTVTEKYSNKVEKTVDGKITYAYEVVEKKRRASIGMMASLNRIGTSMTCTDYSLTTAILRNEWGFEGAVISDSYTPVNNQLQAGIAAGCDFYLSFMKGKISDASTAYAQWSIRQAVKNISYAVVNSNAMQNVTPGMNYHYAMSPWRWIVISVDIVFGALFVGMVTWNILRYTRKKKDGIEVDKVEE